MTSLNIGGIENLMNDLGYGNGIDLIMLQEKWVS
jgi:hypothetical protein